MERVVTKEYIENKNAEFEQGVRNVLCMCFRNASSRTISTATKLICAINNKQDIKFIDDVTADIGRIIEKDRDKEE